MVISWSDGNYKQFQLRGSGVGKGKYVETLRPIHISRILSPAASDRNIVMTISLNLLNIRDYDVTLVKTLKH